MTDETEATPQQRIAVAIYVPDASFQDDLAASIGDLAEDSATAKGISVLDLKKSKAFGSFDLPFYVGLVLSIPLGIGSNLVSSWLWDRIHKPADKRTGTSIRIQIASRTIRMTGQGEAEITQITQAIEIATSTDSAE